MDCPSRDMLERYLDGDVDADERAALEFHLQDCEACVEILRRLDELSATASPDHEAVLPVKPPNLPASLA